MSLLKDNIVIRFIHALKDSWEESQDARDQRKLLELETGLRIERQQIPVTAAQAETMQAEAELIKSKAQLIRTKTHSNSSQDIKEGKGGSSHGSTGHNTKR